MQRDKGYLNDDCWRHVLDYASLMDVMSLGQVCQQWEAVVQRYLEGARIRIETITNVWDVEEEQRRRKCRILAIKDDRILCLNTVLYKWGHLVAELVYDARLAVNEHILQRLGSQCPNVQDITIRGHVEFGMKVTTCYFHPDYDQAIADYIDMYPLLHLISMFVRLEWHSPSCEWAKSFTKLKRVCFENCSILDSCVSELIINNTIEELVFRMTDTVTGRFLLAFDGCRDLTNLNTLILSRCSDLNLNHLQSAVEPVNYLAEVRKLELRDLPAIIHERADLILEKMPWLEHLTFDCAEHHLRAETARAVSRLGRLRRLGWLRGEVLGGRELQAVSEDANRLMFRRSRQEPQERPREELLPGRQRLALLRHAQRRQAHFPPPPAVPNLLPPNNQLLYNLIIEMEGVYIQAPPPHPVP